MKTTVRIALLLTLTIATACRFVADKKDDAVRFLAASVLGSVARLQSTTPLEQSSFRDAEPVGPRKESKEAPVIRAPKKAEKAVTLVAERRVRAPRRVVRVVRVEVPAITDAIFCSGHAKQVEVVVPMADTIGG